MEIFVQAEQKMAQIWLTNGERNVPQVQRQLQAICQHYKKRQYLVAVFASGREDLYQNTLNLLAFNRKRIAQKENPSETPKQ